MFRWGVPRRTANGGISTGWGCYIAESGIACFWAFSLAQAVYGWRDDIRFHRPLIIISEAGKVFPILAAVLTMALLQLDALQRSYFWFSLVMNFFCQSDPIPSLSPPSPPPPPSLPARDENSIHESLRRSTHEVDLTRPAG